MSGCASAVMRIPMRVEIDVYEGTADDGTTRRIRVVREWRDPERSDEAAVIVRDHDSGDVLALGEDGRITDDAGTSYVLTRKLA